MNKTGWVLAIVGILIIIAAIILFVLPGNTKAPTVDGTATTTPRTSNAAGMADLIVVDSPKPGDTISSTTVTITGKARGTWYFEASFPIEVEANTFGGSEIIGQGHAEAQGNWMTEDFVPFTATIKLSKAPEKSQVVLVLKNDNPSGDPARDLKLRIPVVLR